MATIYQSGETIPGSNTKISGGISILLREPEEIVALQAICLLADAGNVPIVSMHEAISNFNETSPAFMSLDKKFDWHERSFAAHESNLRSLYKVLASIRIGWQQQIQKREEISIILSVVSPECSMEPRLVIESDDPALLIHQGSLVYDLLAPGLPLILGTQFIISIFSRAESRDRAKLFEELREKAKKSTNKLEDLRTLTAEGVKVNCTYVIFLHGLLSIDLGTFDPLIDYINSENQGQNIGLYGWPHDTLTSINKNAQALADRLATIFGSLQKPIPNIIFIAHSRGGLVARAAAVKLHDKGDLFEESLQHTFTFGTPHKGSELAEKPSHLKAIFVAWQFFKAEIYMPAFGALLHLVAGEHEGIENLRPSNAKDSKFIRQLREAEEEQVKGQNKFRLLNIHAIGGAVEEEKNTKIKKRFIDRIMDDSSHDLVVRTESSVSQDIGLTATYEWQCDHFNYFQEDQKDRFKIVSDLIHSECQRWKKQDQDILQSGSKNKIILPDQPRMRGRHI